MLLTNVARRLRTWRRVPKDLAIDHDETAGMNSPITIAWVAVNPVNDAAIGRMRMIGDVITASHHHHSGLKVRQITEIILINHL